MSKVITSDCGNTTILPGDEINPEIVIAETAKAKLKDLLREEAEGSFFRVAVGGGGCSGFQYIMGFDTNPEESDVVHALGDGFECRIDDMSIQMMKGSTLSYVEDIQGQYFDVSNPHTVSQCGCGSSFAMDYDPFAYDGEEQGA